ncbi:MAG: hypothetical protein ACRDYV_07080, partial [Acidimicrobiia bacterium]
TCPHCGGVCALDVDGRMRDHPPGGQACTGTDRPPAALTPTPQPGTTRAVGRLSPDGPVTAEGNTGVYVGGTTGRPLPLTPLRITRATP